MTKPLDPRSGNIESLDGLRAIAALSVFAVHFQQLTNFHSDAIGPFSVIRLLINGNTGVALFFVLSGFLLSLPYWSAIKDRTQRPAVTAYWIRRFVRIAPAYYLCLAVLAVENGYWKNPDELNNLLSHCFFLFNYSEDFFYSINPPFWTIGIEMQFYLLLPVLFMILSRFRATMTTIVIALLTVGCYVLHVWIVESSADITAAAKVFGISDLEGAPLTRSVFAHLPVFLIGVLAGKFFSTPASQTNRTNGAFFCTVLFWTSAIVVIIILSTELNELLAIPHGRYTLPIVPLLLAIIILTAPYSPTAKLILNAKPLRWIGMISYGVYLFHLPIQKLAAKVMPIVGLQPNLNWLVFATVSLVATICAASISFVYLERPLLNFFTTKRIR